MFANLIRGTVAAAVVAGTLVSSAVAAAVVAGTLVSSAFAAGVDVNATVTGLALRGVDPVSYFTNGAPKDGDFSITSVHNGATYRFTSEENKNLFEKNPEKYLPQYGGFCAFGTAMGVKVDGDPDLWKIVDSKLYLNLSESIQERWNKDTAGFIETGNDKWTEIENVDPSEL